MSDHAAAGRYARSLFEVCLKESDPARAETELTDFAALFGSYPELEQALTHPAVPVQRKRALVSELVARAGYGPVVSKLLILLAERDRMTILPALVDAYREQLRAHSQVVLADVTTAVPLPEERAQALARSLSHATGRQVTVHTKVDPEIIGGVIARIGSVVYDGSVARQLQKMKDRLVNR